MPIPPIAFKRKNHKLMLCTDAKKKELLAALLQEFEGRRIVVVTIDDAALSIPESVTLATDDALPEEAYDLLIGYDLPERPEAYFKRLGLASETVLSLMSEIDQPRLLAIEAQLGRAITQEVIPRFAPPTEAPKKPHQPGKRAKPFGKPASKPFDKKPAREGKPAAKRQPKESGVSRYVGTDENGKPKFSKNPNQRNHRHDGSPHTEESLAAKKSWEERRKKEGKNPPEGGKKNPPFDKGKKPFNAKNGTETSSKSKPAAPKPKRPVRRIKADQLKPKKEES